MFISKPLVVFLTLSFALSWGYWGLLLGLGLRVTPGSNVSHLPGLMGPAFAALITTAIFQGKRAVYDIFRRSIRVPRDWGAAGLVILAPAFVLLVWLMIQQVRGVLPPNFDQFTAYPGLPIGSGALGFVVFVILLNGYGEEIGWRGYLLETLLPLIGKFRATLCVAAVWMVWHLPLFWLNQSMTDLIGPMLIGWMIGLLLGAFVLSWIYLSFDNSILVVALWHITYNMSVATPATSGIPAAIVSTAVMIMGGWVMWRWRR